MITFRCTNQSFLPNTFITKKTTPIAKTLNAFGYLKSIDKNGKCIVIWYSNYIRTELTFNLKELAKEYKSIYPYYNTPIIRGGIWKYSYLTLLRSIHKDTGFSKIKVDPMTCKIRPIKGNDVEISDARYVLEWAMTDLKGKIIEITNHDRPPIYSIKTIDGVFEMARTSFILMPQDYFILLSIRCN
jgi:hypothetical protein